MMTAARHAAVGLTLVTMVANGCTDRAQSALHPAGPHAERVQDLFVVFVWVAASVWIIVMLALAWALFRGRRRETAALDRASRRRARAAVLGATGATVVILLGLLTVDLIAGRDLAGLTERTPAVTIELIGNQWWWEARYEHANPDQKLTTANEIHIPVGLPVLVKLKSRDVIHSLWVPNLSGKQDMIPGYTNTIWLQADSAGEFRAQCAEYCGHQHAHMALAVIAHEPAEFQQWLAAQLQPAVEPVDDVLRRGREVFLTSACIMCHTIRGTRAGGRTAPDLTHVGGRRTLAAGTLPNSPENLARWIADPHRIKPGVRMPVVPLSSDDRHAVALYLASLR